MRIFSSMLIFFGFEEVSRWDKYHVLSLKGDQRHKTRQNKLMCDFRFWSKTLHDRWTWQCVSLLSTHNAFPLDGTMSYVYMNWNPRFTCMTYDYVCHRIFIFLHFYIYDAHLHWMHGGHHINEDDMIRTMSKCNQSWKWVSRTHRCTLSYGGRLFLHCTRVCPWCLSHPVEVRICAQLNMCMCCLSKSIGNLRFNMFLTLGTLEKYKNISWVNSRNFVNKLKETVLKYATFIPSFSEYYHSKIRCMGIKWNDKCIASSTYSINFWTHHKLHHG